MYIRWHGHACFEVSNGNLCIVTDPHDGKSIGIKPPTVEADIVFVSHSHFDHNCVSTVSKPTTTVVNKPGYRAVKGVKIYGLRTYHDTMNGQMRGENIIFRFVFGDIVFCHLGDLGHPLESTYAEKLGNIDILFIPVGGTFTIDATTAWDVVRVLKPKVIVPMHYRIGGLTLSIQPVDSFIEHADSVEKVGTCIEFESEDIRNSREVWVFAL